VAIYDEIRVGDLVALKEIYWEESSLSEEERKYYRCGIVTEIETREVPKRTGQAPTQYAAVRWHKVYWFASKRGLPKGKRTRESFLLAISLKKLNKSKGED
jgi:hypothetical protein